jgi:hypothetical protein
LFKLYASISIAYKLLLFSCGPYEPANSPLFTNPYDCSPLVLNNDLPIIDIEPKDA